MIKWVPQVSINTQPWKLAAQQSQTPRFPSPVNAEKIAKLQLALLCKKKSMYETYERWLKSLQTAMGSNEGSFCEKKILA